LWWEANQPRTRITLTRVPLRSALLLFAAVRCCCCCLLLLSAAATCCCPLLPAAATVPTRMAAHTSMLIEEEIKPGLVGTEEQYPI
jgi:hypothetical protein